jgi:3-methyladenine DNA glycosylase AlkD
VHYFDLLDELSSVSLSRHENSAENVLAKRMAFHFIVANLGSLKIINRFYMGNPIHQNLLHLIKENSGKGTQHTFSDSYLGNTHPRYEITAPVLRKIAKEWMREHVDLTAAEFADLLASLIAGKSSTEKMFAGMLMDYSTQDQRDFDPGLFDQWLEHLQGWAEVDAICTGDYSVTHIPAKWKRWKPLLKKFSRDPNIQKRRASLVLLCSPVRYTDEPALGNAAIEHIERLKKEKEILITKAISWLLRSLIKNYRQIVIDYMQKNADSLPKIAVRETMVKLKTGTKTKRKT